MAAISGAAARLETVRRLAHEGDPRRIVLVSALLILLAGIFPAYLGVELTREPRIAPRPAPKASISSADVSSADVMENFSRKGFDLAGDLEEPLIVPRIFISRLPYDWGDFTDAAQRKLAFTTVLLPLVLRANEVILKRRARLVELADRAETGKRISARDRLWVKTLAAYYEVETFEVTEKLLNTLGYRVDIVPPSLAIAQAAIESGWGTSRFTVKGNALYGQWAEEGGDAMVPAERDAGRTYAIQSFETLQDSILAYMHNLNTHRAYRKFRMARGEMRNAGQQISGAVLAKHLKAYSQKGGRYVRDLIAIMLHNSLGALDGAELRDRDTVNLVTTSGPEARN